jgi:hypothetical protein
VAGPVGRNISDLTVALSLEDFVEIRTLSGWKLIGGTPA